VRGDLVLEDDTVVTLDELCAQAGLAPPPLLEDMPDELDIPLDDIPIASVHRSSASAPSAAQLMNLRSRLRALEIASTPWGGKRNIP
jgi:hypothetical protein